MDRHVTIVYGFTLRVCAIQTLGKFYTRTLRVTKSYNVVQEGLYKKVRRPGYPDVILVSVGAGLATELDCGSNHNAYYSSCRQVPN